MDLGRDPEAEARSFYDPPMSDLVGPSFTFPPIVARLYFGDPEAKAQSFHDPCLSNLLCCVPEYYVLCNPTLKLPIVAELSLTSFRARRLGALGDKCSTSS